MVHTPWFPFCIYTIRHKQQLRDAYENDRSGEFTENTKWQTGKELYKEAMNKGMPMPILFAASDVDGGLLYSATVRSIEIDETKSTTTFSFTELTPISQNIPLSILRLRSNNETLSDNYIRPYALCHTPAFLKTTPLVLYQQYNREEIHNIFAPGTPFTPQAGTWGLQGIVAIPDRPGDFVFFVTFGQQQGEHVFDEGITVEGVLSWQSQPKQNFRSGQIQQLIEHDELKNSIYLFLRTGKNRTYTYFGRLKYLSHDTERQNPVYFQWQILDWDIPQDLVSRIGLTLQPSTEEITGPTPELRNVLVENPPPDVRPRQGTRTSSFRSRKVADYSANDAKNRKLGLAGELLVLEHEVRLLKAAGRNDLADRVRHVADIEGDGAGYDIESFTLEGELKYIEVKTTKGAAETPFYMTSNELAFSAQHQRHFFLYRVYEYDKDRNTGKMYVVHGNVEEYFNLTAIRYRVSV